MKTFALDLGDKWVGSAISDGLGITCRPYKTVEIEEFKKFLKKTLSEEFIQTIVVGLPTTISGKESDQTKKIKKTKEELEEEFPQVKWVLWDERLSSKRAEKLQGKSYKDKKAKMESHSIAAAFILQSYLDSIAFHKN